MFVKDNSEQYAQITEDKQFKEFDSMIKNIKDKKGNQGQDLIEKYETEKLLKRVFSKKKKKKTKIKIQQKQIDVDMSSLSAAYNIIDEAIENNDEDEEEKTINDIKSYLLVDPYFIKMLMIFQKKQHLTKLKKQSFKSNILERYKVRQYMIPEANLQSFQYGSNTLLSRILKRNNQMKNYQNLFDIQYPKNSDPEGWLTSEQVQSYMDNKIQFDNQGNQIIQSRKSSNTWFSQDSDYINMKKSNGTYIYNNLSSMSKSQSPTKLNNNSKLTKQPSINKSMSKSLSKQKSIKITNQSKIQKQTTLSFVKQNDKNENIYQLDILKEEQQDQQKGDKQEVDNISEIISQNMQSQNNEGEEDEGLNYKSDDIEQSDSQYRNTYYNQSKFEKTQIQKSAREFFKNEDGNIQQRDYSDFSLWYFYKNTIEKQYKQQIRQQATIKVEYQDNKLDLIMQNNKNELQKIKDQIMAQKQKKLAILNEQIKTNDGKMPEIKNKSGNLQQTLSNFCRTALSDKKFNYFQKVKPQNTREISKRKRSISLQNLGKLLAAKDNFSNDRTNRECLYNEQNYKQQVIDKRTINKWDTVF